MEQVLIRNLASPINDATNSYWSEHFILKTIAEDLVNVSCFLIGLKSTAGQ